MPEQTTRLSDLKPGDEVMILHRGMGGEDCEKRTVDRMTKTLLIDNRGTRWRLANGQESGHGYGFHPPHCEPMDHDKFRRIKRDALVRRYRGEFYRVWNLDLNELGEQAVIDLGRELDDLKRRITRRISTAQGGNDA